jgi:hypothetical protein
MAGPSMPRTRSPHAAGATPGYWLGWIALLMLLGGCAITHEGKLDPALFARSPPVSRAKASGRVALLVPPPVRDTVVLGESLIDSPILNHHVRVPIGHIVEEAALAALDDALSGGVKRAASLPSSDQGFAATLVIDAVRFEYRDRLQYLLPIPVPGMPIIVGSRVDVRLELDLRLIDAQGQAVLARSHAAGPEVWTPKPRTTEQAEDGIVRLAHEAAWRLAQQAAGELRAWLEAQRTGP